VRADNSRHIVQAARNRHEYTRAKAIQALREIETAGTPVTFDAVARTAKVSRSWLYSQQDLRTEIERLRAAVRRAGSAPLPARQRASDASLQQRLEAANERNRRLTEEDHQVRQQLARALGDLRAAGLRTPTTPPTRQRGRGSTTIGPC
jgi:Family of unknown function (DUF6262)